jgi:hypothetical protein
MSQLSNLSQYRLSNVTHPKSPLKRLLCVLLCATGKQGDITIKSGILQTETRRSRNCSDRKQKLFAGEALEPSVNFSRDTILITVPVE